METYRDIVSKIAIEVYSDTLLPERAVDLRRELSAIYGNVLDVIQTTELAYNTVLLSFLDAEKAASKARIKANTTQEYQNFINAKNTEKMLLKMMSSLNTFITSKKEEYKTGSVF